MQRRSKPGFSLSTFPLPEVKLDGLSHFNTHPFCRCRISIPADLLALSGRREASVIGLWTVSPSVASIVCFACFFCSVNLCLARFDTISYDLHIYVSHDFNVWSIVIF